MTKLLAIALLAATWQTDDIEQGRASVAFTATIVPAVSVQWDEAWSGDIGIAHGVYSDPERTVAFMLPLKRGEIMVLTPDPMPHKDGISYALLDDYAIEAVAWQY